MARGIDLEAVDRDFLVRELWGAKGLADLETIDASSLTTCTRDVGWTGR